MRETGVISTAVRMLERVLHLYPKSFREVFAADMLLTFRDQCRARYAKSGAPGVIGVWLLTALNVTWEAIREHLNTGQSEARIGAVALFTGGVLWFLMHTRLAENVFTMLGIWFVVVPLISLTATFVGIAAVMFSLSRRAHVVAWIGFGLSVVGVLILLGGLISAWFGWIQTGRPTLIGLILMGVGLFLMTPSLMPEDHPIGWSVLLFPIGVVYCLHGLWILIAAAGTPIFWSGNIVFGMAIGLLWTVIALLLWRGSRSEIGRIA